MSLGGTHMNRIKINHDWIFWKDGCEAEKKVIRLPHDAMVTEERQPDMFKGNMSGFFPGGKYIYEKVIFGDPSWEGKHMLLEFEGVYMDSSVYLNGEKVGGWIYGYTDFFVDISGKLKTGEENMIHVVVDNSRTPNSRWYTGSGIYRDVWLWTGNTSRILPDGIKVKTVSINPAVVDVSIDTENAGGCEIEFSICDGEKCIVSGKGAQAQLEIPDAKLWDAEAPHLYTIKAVLKRCGEVIDSDESRFGIRTLAWDARNGFQVNGNTVKLRGGCIHHDHGPLGAAYNSKAEFRRVLSLKEMGFNAIRCAHNPSNRDLMDICDEVGMYVLEETFDQWKIPQSDFDYALHFDSEWQKDVAALVRICYNHPCVIMYCSGNEIPDTGLPHGAIISKAISGLIKSLDDTRPIMLAINSMLSVMAAKMAEQKEKAKENVGSQEVNDIVTLLPKIRASITADNLEPLLAGCLEPVDIVGYNYGENLYEGIHRIAPERIILSSETFPSRLGGDWKLTQENNHIIGNFMWSAWDYLGEAGVGLPIYGTTQAPFTKTYPALTGACACFDITGFADSQAYYTAVLWGAYKKPYIGVRPVDHAGEEYTIGLWRLTDAVNSWSWPGQEGKIADIEIYAPGVSVELRQDGVSLGRQPLENCRAFFKAEYKPGSLEAICFDEGGSEMARSSLLSAENDNNLSICAEDLAICAGGEDITFVHIAVTDEKGTVKMLSDRKISVQVEGGELLAVASGNPESTERFDSGTYTSYHGRITAIVAAMQPGVLRVSATTDDMEAASIEIQVY